LILEENESFPDTSPQFDQIYLGAAAGGNVIIMKMDS
jgi:hypothetical protein